MTEKQIEEWMDRIWRSTQAVSLDADHQKLADMLAVECAEDPASAGRVIAALLLVGTAGR